MRSGAKSAHGSAGKQRINRLPKPQDYLVVKELQTDIMPKREALQALNEIEIHARLANSPYIVKYYDSFISGTKVNIIMEHCPNGDLQGLLRTKRCANRPITES